MQNKLVSVLVEDEDGRNFTCSDAVEPPFFTENFMQFQALDGTRYGFNLQRVKRYEFKMKDDSNAMPRPEL